MHVGPAYSKEMYQAPESFSKLVTQMVKAARAIDKINPFAMLAGCGNSSLPLLGAMGLRLKKPILACRKKGDTTHDYGQVNGHIVNGKYLIIDDLIDSGATVEGIRNNILATVARRHILDRFPGGVYHFGDVRNPVKTWMPSCAGILLYHNRWATNFSFRCIDSNFDAVEVVPTYFCLDNFKGS